MIDQFISNEQAASYVAKVACERLPKIAPEFFENVTNWNNHRPMLALGLMLTKGAVLELGSGDGSTPLLRKVCEQEGRIFASYDNNVEWSKKMEVYCVSDWSNEINRFVTAACYELIFIDHAPGERRAADAIALKDAAQILVLHDTEEGGAGNYGWEKAWPHFRYRLNYNRLGGGAGATMVSNFIDVTVYRGLQIGPFKFDND